MYVWCRTSRKPDADTTESWTEWFQRLNCATPRSRTDDREMATKAPTTTPISLKAHASRRRAEESRLPKLLGPTQAADEHLQPHALLRDPRVVRELAPHVQERFGISGTWHLLFWSALHGTSLHHLLRCAAGAGPCLLLVRERGRRTFGALCSELRELSTVRHGESHFYGDGQCCLLALPGAGGEPRGDGAKGSSGGASSADAVVRLFPWSRANQHFIWAGKAVATAADVATAGSAAAARGYEGDALVIGLGGACGLMLDSALQRGASGPCDTFDSPPLPRAAETGGTSGAGGGGGGGSSDGGDAAMAPGPEESDTVDFECETVEVWALSERRCLEHMPQCKRHVPIRGARPTATRESVDVEGE